MSTISWRRFDPRSARANEYDSAMIASADLKTVAPDMSRCSLPGEPSRFRKSHWLLAMHLLAILTGCTTVVDPSMTTNVSYAAREWSDHDDGRTYGGVISPTERLSGVLGSHSGCLVDTQSQLLIVLTGAMEFHQSDRHSPKQHVYSKSVLGDEAPQVIAVGDPFMVQGSRVDSFPEGFRLERTIPVACVELPLFMTSSQTFSSAQPQAHD